MKHFCSEGPKIITAPVFLGRDLADKTNAMHIQLSSGRSDRLMRVTTASQERFSCCGYLRSKQSANS
jgi:hypothetical protein